MQLCTKAALFVVGVPYFLVVASNIFYGWPNSNGEDNKFSRALDPHRVYKLNYAFLEQLSLLKWAPLWLQWNRFYYNSDPTLKVLIMYISRVVPNLQEPTFILIKKKHE